MRSRPARLLASVTAVSLLGETINLMTLGDLALAVGILVDDAPVTIENINWRLESGEEIETAILDSSGTRPRLSAFSFAGGEGEASRLVDYTSVDLIIAIASLVVWIYMLAGRQGFWLCREFLLTQASPSDSEKAWPEIVAIVPARNEADLIERRPPLPAASSLSWPFGHRRC
jgi:hypothetical protein